MSERASLDEAAARLHVTGVVQERDGPVWWALPNRWDGEQFMPMPQPAATLAGLR